MDFDTLDHRLVALSDDYENDKIWCSHMVTQLCTNGPDLVDKFGDKMLEKITAISKYLKEGYQGTEADIQAFYMQEIQPSIVHLIDLTETYIFDEGYDGTDDGFSSPRWKERLLNSRIAIECGANPLFSPEIFGFTVTLLGIRMRDLTRGIPLNKGDGMMAIALPSRNIKETEILLNTKHWETMGKPASVKVVRYPLNGSSEIVTYSVVPSDHIKGARIHPVAWSKNHNGDFDKDLIFVYNLPLMPKDFGKMELPTIEKGSKVQLTPYAELLETWDSYRKIGSVCLNQEMLIGLHDIAPQEDMKPLICKAGIAYHLSIQAVKQIDYDVQEIIDDIRSYAHEAGLERNFWRMKKFSINRNNYLEAFNNRVKEIKELNVATQGWDKFVRTRILNKMQNIEEVQLPKCAKNLFQAQVWSSCLKNSNKDALVLTAFLEDLFAQAAIRVGANKDDTELFGKYRRFVGYIRQGRNIKISGKDWAVRPDGNGGNVMIPGSKGMTTIRMTPEIYFEVTFRWAYKVAKSKKMGLWSLIEFRHIGILKLVFGMNPQHLLDQFKDWVMPMQVIK
jgi:hypothetical protein